MNTLIDTIIAYEQGELNEEEIINLFAELIKTGHCWTLQGHYGRTAQQLINQGIITKKGTITQQGKQILKGSGKI